MKPAGSVLDDQQKSILAQLAQAVEKLNEAQNLLANNRANDAISSNAVALSLVAIAKLMLITKADEWGMLDRLPPLK